MTNKASDNQQQEPTHQIFIPHWSYMGTPLVTTSARPHFIGAVGGMGFGLLLASTAAMYQRGANTDTPPRPRAAPPEMTVPAAPAPPARTLPAPKPFTLKWSYNMAGPANDLANDLAMDGPDVMQNVPATPHVFYTHADNRAVMDKIAPAMSALAGVPVMHIDPDDYNSISVREWAGIVARHTLDNPTPSQRSMLNINYSVARMTASATDGGRNFLSSRATNVADGKTGLCVITGEADPDLRTMLRSFSNLPDNYLQGDFMQQFDLHSLRSFVYLHEAAHCNQDQTTRRGDAANHTLHFEIDADRQAAIAYAQLTATDPTLDKDLPAKFRAVRVLGAVLPAQGGLNEVLGSLMSRTHATGFVANNNSESTARPEDAIGDMASSLDVSLALLSYAQLNPADRARHTATAQPIFDAMGRAIGENKPELVAPVMALMRPMIIGALANNDDQTLLLRSIQLLAHTSLDGVDTSKLPTVESVQSLQVMQSGAQQFMAAWQTLNLPSLSSAETTPNQVNVWQQLVDMLVVVLPKEDAKAETTTAAGNQPHLP